MNFLVILWDDGAFCKNKKTCCWENHPFNDQNRYLILIQGVLQHKSKRMHITQLCQSKIFTFKNLFWWSKFFCSIYNEAFFQATLVGQVLGTFLKWSSNFFQTIPMVTFSITLWKFKLVWTNIRPGFRFFVRFPVKSDLFSNSL